MTSQPLDSPELAGAPAVAPPGAAAVVATVVATCARIAESKRFQFLILGVIAANAVLIGMETYPGLYESYGSIFERLDRIFLAIFVVELVVRLTAYGARPWLFFRRGWNIFDFAIVAASFIPGISGNVTVLRLIRVLRVVRLVEAIEDLRVIVRGLLRSMAPLAGVASLVMILVYVYGVVGTVLFGEALPEEWGTVGAAMFTCFRVLTLDNWDDIYFPAAEVNGLALVYFLSFILVATFVIMNIVIAVVVNSVEEARRSELEENADAIAQSLSDQTPELAERILALRQALDQLEQNLGEARQPPSA